LKLHLYITGDTIYYLHGIAVQLETSKQSKFELGQFKQ